jgi:hypothetical protein
VKSGKCSRELKSTRLPDSVAEAVSGWSEGFPLGGPSSTLGSGLTRPMTDARIDIYTLDNSIPYPVSLLFACSGTRTLRFLERCSQGF